MIKFRQLLQARRMLDAGKLGDGAVLKVDAMGATMAPDVEARLEAVRGYLPRIDLDALRALPEGTLGRVYADHMHAHGLKPFEVSEGFDPEMLRRNAFAVRYAVTHDLFHVLLGFDTRYPGEMGVLAFAVAQRYSAIQRVGLLVAAVLYPLLAPTEALRTFRCMREGLRLGRSAGFLLGVRFEEWWERPLGSVRRELGLPDPSPGWIGFRPSPAPRSSGRTPANDASSPHERPRSQ